MYLEDKSLFKQERFSVGHEGTHIVKDGYFFAECSSEMVSVFSNNETKHKYWQKGKPTVELIERQTDYLTAAILLPKTQVKSEFFKSLRWRTIPNEPIIYENYMNRGIGILSKLYGVSFNTVLYRLREIGVFADQTVSLKEV